ncbi:MAG TPA: Asp-tRNA(Asn)/Glu-tRNA(Gln) amidotransferase subunit GatC [Gemmatimonadaceae bacterium]|nr:Asp-tRNA(Asn)/Glu-tRNA(Gln) amidotransferase subunit GatC [Gemmatimonadaceae bacterium]
MSVSLDDVRHIAALARLGLSDERARSVVAELNTILAHMDVLSNVDTSGLEPVAGIGAAGMPLRPDAGPPIPLARERESFAPRMRDGFFLVPRLSTHEDPEEA